MRLRLLRCWRGPGDTLIIEPLDSSDPRAEDGACSDFVENSNEPGITLAGTILEYRIVETSGNAVRIEVMPDEPDAAERADALPNPACFDLPFPFELRAGDSWLPSGTGRNRYRGGLTEVNGACVPVSDAAVRQARPIAGQEWTSSWGNTYLIENGTSDDCDRFECIESTCADGICAIEPLRDFQIGVSSNGRFTRSSLLIRGGDITGGVSIPTSAGQNLVYVDQATNTLLSIRNRRSASYIR